MRKINFVLRFLVFLTAAVIFISGECTDKGGECLRKAATDKCILNGTVYKGLCKCTLEDAGSFDGTNCRTCSLLNSHCSNNQHCCPISDGKSYCNVKNGRCEAIRYCEESSVNNKCPFDDLSLKEITDTIRIIKQSNSFSSQIEFPIVRAQEPKKQEWNSGEYVAKQRIAYAAVLDFSRNLLSEVLVSLSSQSIISRKDRPQSVALVAYDEYDRAEQMLLSDHRIINGYERRGLNMSYASFDVWAIGATGNVGGERLLRAVPNYKDPRTKYSEWRPLEGLEATINLSQGKIVNFIDDGDVPVPTSPELSDSIEEPLKPLKIVQLKGSSIEVNGYIIKWFKWKLQYSMDPVHGLQFYHIRYFGDCEERFLIYKISVSEMFVPYGAKGKTWRWRGAFDSGEYGLGRSATAVILGQDVPENSVLLSCPQLNDGEVKLLKGCIALYERDGGSSYKHFDVRVNKFQKQNNAFSSDKDSSDEDGKRSREMVAVYIATVGNYDYMFEYVFKMDGNIDVGVHSTGIVLPRATIQTKNHPNCIEDCQDFINENTIAPTHQHFFNYRIDFDVEGTNNLLTEVNFVNDPKGPENLDGGAFSLRRTIIREEAFRDYSPANARFWTIINPQSRNKYNTPRGYAIHPAIVAFPFLQNPYLSQALFITHPFWVTSYNDDEQAAAGDFPRSGKSGQGLPQYIGDHESLDNGDLVTWYTMGLTHAPRPEEYPFMNSIRVGFYIVSRNFQSSNPLVRLENQCH